MLAGYASAIRNSMKSFTDPAPTKQPVVDLRQRWAAARGSGGAQLPDGEREQDRDGGSVAHSGTIFARLRGGAVPIREPQNDLPATKVGGVHNVRDSMTPTL